MGVSGKWVISKLPLGQGGHPVGYRMGRLPKYSNQQTTRRPSGIWRSHWTRSALLFSVHINQSSCGSSMCLPLWLARLIFSVSALFWVEQQTFRVNWTGCCSKKNKKVQLTFKIALSLGCIKQNISKIKYCALQIWSYFSTLYILYQYECTCKSEQRTGVAIGQEWGFGCHKQTWRVTEGEMADFFC